MLPDSCELRRRLRRLDLREAEVQNFDLTRRRQHHVRRFHVAMDDAGRVCRGERVGDLRDDAGNLGDGHLARARGEPQGFLPRSTPWR